MGSHGRRQLDLQDTISALASGSLPSAVAILRLSGPQSLGFAEKFFQPSFQSSGPWTRRRGMSYGAVLDPMGREIDRVLLLSFLAPHSFTGEDVIEIHCHGSVAIVNRLQALFVDCGIRPAGRGEFTYRSFLHDKMSLTDIEALGDVFLAQDPEDLDRIYQRKDVSIAAEITVAREQLIRLQAVLDTAVDFSEEYGNVVDLAQEPLERAVAICQEIIGRYESFRTGSRTPRLVLAGRPNAGKSSLFNALLCRYRAIVHEAAGTTRDAIEEDINLGSRRWKLVDTAGIRPAESETEKKGLELGEDFLEGASTWLLVVDGAMGLHGLERDLLTRFSTKPHCIVWNKTDLSSCRSVEAPRGIRAVPVSARTGEGIQELVNALNELARSEGAQGPLPLSIQARRLRDAEGELQALKKDFQTGTTPEVLAEKNRAVLRRLEAIVGDVGVEEVLDRVFTEFCIGK